MNEAEIRFAVRRLLSPGALVREELGLLNHSARADLAFLRDESFDLLEIKSETDRIDRLPAQVRLYSSVADRCWLASTGRNLEKGVALVPEWWGVLEAAHCGRGVVLLQRRAPSPNPGLHAPSLAGMLWGEELRSALRPFGVSARGLSKRQKAEALANALPLESLRSLVRRRLRNRATAGFAWKPFERDQIPA